MALYRILHPATSKVVNLYSTSTAIEPKDGDKLLLYSWQNNSDQKFDLKYYNNGDYVYMCLERKPSLVINRNSNNNSAHVWTWNASSQATRYDSLINTETTSGNTRLLLVNRNLYLTKNANDNYLTWSAKINSDRQYFKLEAVSPSGGGTNPPPSGGYQWPTASPYITSYFGWRDMDGDGYKEDYHNGIDLRASVGTPIYAFCDGVISYMQYAGEYPNSNSKWTMGNCITINSNSPDTNIAGPYLRHNYMHLLDNPNNTWRKGTAVTKGTFLGYSGETGNITGPHLHFGIQAGSYASFSPSNYNDGWVSESSGYMIDPTRFLK